MALYWYHLRDDLRLPDPDRKKFYFPFYTYIDSAFRSRVFFFLMIDHLTDCRRHDLYVSTGIIYIYSEIDGRSIRDRYPDQYTVPLEIFSYGCGDCTSEEKCVMKIPMLSTVPLKCQIIVDTELGSSFHDISNSFTAYNQRLIIEAFC